MDLNRTMLPSGRVSGGYSYLRRGCMPIQLAAEQGDIEMLQVLLDLGAKIDLESSHQRATLHYGILSKDRKVVEFLLQNGAIVDPVDSFSSICKAIQSDLSEIVPLLIENGANVNASEDAESPLSAAWRIKNFDLVELLSKHGAHFHDTDAKVATEILEKGTLEEFKSLLEAGLNVNARYKHYESVIQSAARQTNTKAMLMLLDLGADVRTDGNKDLLPGVCDKGHMEMASFLLDNGAEACVSHALYRASGVANNLAVIELLLSRGADIFYDEEGNCFSAAGRIGCQKNMNRLLQEPMHDSERVEYLGRALQRSLWCGEFSFCTWLLDLHDAPINHVGSPYGSPLQAALSWTGRDVNTRLIYIRKLVERGANLNPPTTYRHAREMKAEKQRKLYGFKRNESQTYAPPLSLALAGSSWGQSLQPLAAEFLFQGADPNGVGGLCNTPLQTAAIYYPKLIGALLDAGAEINAISGRFGSALHAASWQNDVDAVKLLLDRGADARILAGKYGSVLQAAARGGKWCRSNNKAGIQVMELLLAAGADLHATDGKYGSAVQMAAFAGNLDALKWLRDHGADIRVKGGRFGNAYKAAMKNVSNNKAVQWHVVSWLEQHYGREGWE